MNGVFRKTACGLAMVPLLLVPWFHPDPEGEGSVQEKKQEKKKDTAPPDLTGVWRVQLYFKGEARWVDIPREQYVVAKVPKSEEYYEVAEFRTNGAKYTWTIVRKTSPELYEGKLSPDEKGRPARWPQCELRWDGKGFVFAMGIDSPPDLITGKKGAIEKRRLIKRQKLPK